MHQHHLNHLTPQKKARAYFSSPNKRFQMSSKCAFARFMRIATFMFIIFLRQKTAIFWPLKKERQKEPFLESHLLFLVPNKRISIFVEYFSFLYFWPLFHIFYAFWSGSGILLMNKHPSVYVVKGAKLISTLPVPDKKALKMKNKGQN